MNVNYRKGEKNKSKKKLHTPPLSLFLLKRKNHIHTKVA